MNNNGEGGSGVERKRERSEGGKGGMMDGCDGRSFFYLEQVSYVGP